jgi:hypothetical protein
MHTGDPENRGMSRRVFSMHAMACPLKQCFALTTSDMLKFSIANSSRCTFDKSMDF